MTDSKIQFIDLKALLAADAVDQARQAIAGRTADFALDSVELLPVIPNPGKIWCCGLNYREHVEETGNTESEKPTFFARYADSQVGHEQDMPRPPESEQFDYEGEIAVVIGKAGRHIPASRALDHVAGYACYNEGSVRDWQRHTSQFLAGKTFADSGSFGPWLVTTDEIPEIPSSLSPGERHGHGPVSSIHVYTSAKYNLVSGTLGECRAIPTLPARSPGSSRDAPWRCAGSRG